MFNMGQFGSSFGGGPLNGFDVMVMQSEEDAANLFHKLARKITSMQESGYSNDDIYHTIRADLDALDSARRRKLIRIMSYGEKYNG